MEWDFSGKTAIVTGGSRGIGRAIVKRLSDAGAHVIFTYAINKWAAGETIRECNKGHTRVSAYRCNFASKIQISRFLTHIKSTFGDSIHLVVNNAGATLDTPFLTMTENNWQHVHQVNLGALFSINQALVRPLALTQGSIVNISSVSGITGIAGQVHYSSAKAGVIGFTKALAKEIGSLGVRVNAVAPGYIESEMVDKIPLAKRNKLRSSIALRRLGRVEEIAETVMFLLSDKASYLTGQTLIVDGGLL